MYLFLDCETGGLSENTSLLTLSMIVTDEKFVTLDELDWRLKPEDGIYVVTAQALSVNKIDLIDHDKTAKPYKEMKTPLSIFLHKWWAYNNCRPIIPVGKNVSFDTRRIFNCLVSKGHWETMVSYQPYELNGAWRLLESQGKVPILRKTSLSDLCNHFNIPVLDSHSSLGDCRLYIELIKRLVQL